MHVMLRISLSNFDRPCSRPLIRYNRHPSSPRQESPAGWRTGCSFSTCPLYLSTNPLAGLRVKGLGRRGLAEKSTPLYCIDRIQWLRREMEQNIYVLET